MENEVQVTPSPNKKGKWTRILSSGGVVGLFASVGLIVLAVTSPLSFSPGVLCAVAVIACLCIGCALATPWVNYLETKQHVKLSWIFLGFVIGCTLLWVVSCFVVLAMYNRIKANGGMESIVGLMWFIRIALVITFQFITSTFIASNIIKYGKKMIAFQVIAYISNLFVDVYFTMAAFALNFNLAKKTITFNTSIAEALISPTMLTLIALALAYVLLSNSIIKRINGETTGSYNRNNRRNRGSRSTLGGMLMDSVVENLAADAELGQQATQPKTAPKEKKTNNVADKLTQLKEMYDQQLITKEEYEQKRADILKDL